jgi:hypothetical protein
MLARSRSTAGPPIFLATTVLTSVTGFFFPSDKILPSHIVGILSLVILALAILGFYVYRLAGSWRWIYVVTAVVALYFNVFVGVVQAFGKVSFLHAQAPTQSEPPFIVAQAIVLVIYIALGFKAIRSFHPASVVRHRGRLEPEHQEANGWRRRRRSRLGGRRRRHPRDRRADRPALMRALSLPRDDAIHARPSIAAVRRIDRHAEFGDLDPVVILDFLDDLGQHRPGFFVELPVGLGIAKNRITIGRHTHLALAPEVRSPVPPSALFATAPIMLADGSKR